MRRLRPLGALAAVLVARSALAAPVPDVDARVERLLQNSKDRSSCHTDVRAAREAIERRAPLAPPPPSVNRPVLRHGATPPAIVVLDATCIEGNCPAKFEWETRNGVRVHEVDTFAAASRFYSLYADTPTEGWDEIIFFTTFVTTMIGGAAYIPVANEVRGIAKTYFGGNEEVFNYNEYAKTGSRGFLRGTVLMSEWHKCLAAQSFRFPCDNSMPFKQDQNSIVGVLGQEVGHRWGAFLHFDDGGVTSDELLGRSVSHWSYYADSDGSPLEGNHWVRSGAGAFTQEAVTVSRFGPLDRYAMGLLAPTEVPPTLVVRDPVPAPCTLDKEDPNAFAHCRTNASTSPADGVRELTGIEQQVTLDQIVRVEGARQPAFPDSPRIIHIAWALLELEELHATDAEMLLLDELRRTFTRWFYEATERRMRAITTLSRRDDFGLWDFTLDAEGWQAPPTSAQPTMEARGKVTLRPFAGEVVLQHPKLELDAWREKYLQVRVGLSGPLKGQAKLGWWTSGEQPEQQIDLPTVLDGRVRTLVIPMEGRPGWQGLVRGLSLRFADGVTGSRARVEIESIETTETPLAGDADGDFLADDDDNCPFAANPDQRDVDGDGTGDVCQKGFNPDGSGGDASEGCGCGGSVASSMLLAVFAHLVRRRRFRHQLEN